MKLSAISIFFFFFSLLFNLFEVWVTGMITLKKSVKSFLLPASQIVIGSILLLLLLHSTTMFIALLMSLPYLIGGILSILVWTINIGKKE